MVGTSARTADAGRYGRSDQVGVRESRLAAGSALLGGAAGGPFGCIGECAVGLPGGDPGQHLGSIIPQTGTRYDDRLWADAPERLHAPERWFRDAERFVDPSRGHMVRLT